MEAQAADAFKAEMGWANLQFLLSSNCWLGYWSLWLENENNIQRWVSSEWSKNERSNWSKGWYLFIIVIIQSFV